MKDYQQSIEKLRADAAEAALIRDLATDKLKRAMYSRLHEHFCRLADEVEKALASQSKSRNGADKLSSSSLNKSTETRVSG